MINQLKNMGYTIMEELSGWHLRFERGKKWRFQIMEAFGKLLKKYAPHIWITVTNPDGNWDTNRGYFGAVKNNISGRITRDAGLTMELTLKYIQGVFSGFLTPPMRIEITFRESRGLLKRGVIKVGRQEHHDFPELSDIKSFCIDRWLLQIVGAVDENNRDNIIAIYQWRLIPLWIFEDQDFVIPAVAKIKEFNKKYAEYLEELKVNPKVKKPKKPSIPDPNKVYIKLNRDKIKEYIMPFNRWDPYNPSALRKDCGIVTLMPEILRRWVQEKELMRYRTIKEIRGSKNGAKKAMQRKGTTPTKRSIRNLVK